MFIYSDDFKIDWLIIPVQDSKFIRTSHEQAVKLALDAFTANAPPVVNEKKRKIPSKRNKSG